MAKLNGAAPMSPKDTLAASPPAFNGNGVTPHLTPLDDFRELRVHGKVATLQSSGRVVRWRPVHLARMLKAGKIPDRLTALVVSLVYGGEAEKDTRSDQEKAIEWQDYLDWIATCTLMEPVVSDDPSATNAILPEDLFHEELLELDRMARFPLDAVRPFRGEQARDVEPVRQGETGEQAAE